MSVTLPDPLPLDMPPGDPASLEDFVEDVAGSGYRLAVVATCLSSSSASAPHWRGADASAAAAQVAVVARLADELSGAVAAAANRLRAHHDHLVLTRRRIAALRTQQTEDFSRARARLREIPDFLTGVPEDAAAVVEDLAAAGAARRREYDRLIEDFADDAAGTARALADACRGVGGTGRPEASELVVAHLAAQLPGWGDRELMRRGDDLAEAMSGLLSPSERESLARHAVAWAGAAAFAGAFLAGLGEYGVRQMLLSFGDGDLGPGSALARMLAFALGAAPAGTGQDPVDAVLTATYIDPAELGSYPDLVALGMGTVLRAGGSAGPRAATVVSWARQVLDRERALGGGFIRARAIDRASPLYEAVDPADPVRVMVERLAREHDPGSAANILGDRRAWDVLLARSWDGDAAPLGRLVAHAATADEADGGVAVRAGLEALGAGLADGDPDDWTVDRDTAAAIAPALGAAAAAQMNMVADALSRGTDGELGRGDGDVLRGLGYLTLDPEAVAAVGGALRGLTQDQTVTSEGSRPASQPTAGATAGAFVAVREYGQRLAYALHGFEQRTAAEHSSDRWDGTWGLVPNLVRRVGPGIALGLVSDYAAIALGRDGTWQNGPDDGLVFDVQDAERVARGALPGRPVAEVEELEAKARVAFDNTVAALGRPRPPMSPPVDWLEPVRNAVQSIAFDRVGEAAARKWAELVEGAAPVVGAGAQD